MYELVITTAFGVESVTKRELRRMGVNDPKAVEGSIFVTGDDRDIARFNLELRTGERVYIKLASFKAETFDQLFEGTRAVAWEDILPADANVIVNGKSKKSTLYALSSCQSIIKKAILVRLMNKKHIHTFDETGATYDVEFAINENNVTLLLNTSGKGLHKRGYRDLVAPAQMKETLASAIVSLSDMYWERPFIDPFCGCGTFVIEAALAALHIAPGKNRDFDFLHWNFYPQKQYQDALQEALDNEKKDRTLHFCGYDIDPEVIKLALHHAQNAGIEDKVHFQVRDVKELSSRFSEGVICCDPPYGKRLLDVKEAKKLTEILGQKYRDLGKGWSCYVVSAVSEFERHFGQRAEKNRKFFNANELCRLYCYPVERKRKEKETNETID